MKSFLISAICLTGILTGCSRSKKPDPSSIPTGKYDLAIAFPNLVFTTPVELTAPNDNTDRIFVVDQRGIISVFANNSTVGTSSVFLDIRSKVQNGGETGLLGLTFHPNYQANGYFYVNYTKSGPLETIIARYKVSASNPNVADPASETILLRYAQPFTNHNGGKVAFGPDGYLYIASGDGGSGGDPQNNGQNLKTLLGKILRIDVNNTSGSLNYSIPQDNLFKNNTSGNREEIYAYGLRNPWRFSFDRQTGTLWAGDVGQSSFEEIDIIEKGGNYGWRITEGNECYDPANNCNKTGLTEPVLSYGRSDGVSVTGGYVNRSSSLPGLNGRYIYGDFGSGNIWALTFSGKSVVRNELIEVISGGLSSFGEDSKGNIYALSYNSGRIYKFVAEQ